MRSNNALRILHINRNYLGTSLHQNMINKLNDIGVRSDVFVPTHYESSSVITPNDNVHISECFGKIDSLFFYNKQRKIYRAIQENFHLGAYDVIHAYTLFTDGNCARKISKQLGIPYVVAVRNTDVNDFFPKQPHLRKRGMSILLDASAVFFLSETYKDLVIERYVPQKYKNMILDKAYVIPNGIDDFWFENKVNENNIKVNNRQQVKLIYAGKIDKNKNISTTQDAVKKLISKGYDVRLTVVGKVVDKNEYNKLNKDKNTSFFEPVNKENLINFYRQNDLFVMPSYTETFGLVYAEAMSQGLPVIYSKGQGFDKQFEEGTVGYHVDSKSSDEVCSAIISIIENYALYSKNAIKSVEKFNWNKIVKKYKEVYLKCLLKNDIVGD